MKPQPTRNTRYLTATLQPDLWRFGVLYGACYVLACDYQKRCPVNSQNVLTRELSLLSSQALQYCQTEEAKQSVIVGHVLASVWVRTLEIQEMEGMPVGYSLKTPWCFSLLAKLITDVPVPAPIFVDDETPYGPDMQSYALRIVAFIILVNAAHRPNPKAKL